MTGYIYTVMAGGIGPRRHLIRHSEMMATPDIATGEYQSCSDNLGAY